MFPKISPCARGVRALQQPTVQSLQRGRGASGETERKAEPASAAAATVKVKQGADFDTADSPLMPPSKPPLLFSL